MRLEKYLLPHSLSLSFLLSATSLHAQPDPAGTTPAPAASASTAPENSPAPAPPPSSAPHAPDPSAVGPRSGENIPEPVPAQRAPSPAQYTVPVAGAPRSGENIGPATPPGEVPADGVFPPTPPQFTIETADHVNRLRLGLLVQGQYEAKGASASQGLTQNLFVRRAGIFVGGRALKYFDYLFVTDFSNLFKETATGDPPVKAGPSIQVKDVVATARIIEDAFKIDVGLFLPPGSHNFLQGNTTLFGWDFFLNTYRASTVFGSTNDPYGRDTGIQVRGLVLNKVLEYRVGAFQGIRNPPVAGPPAGSEGRNPFRVAGRLQLNFLDPETGLYYGGTYLGTQKVFSVGGFVDYQHDNGRTYGSFGGDALFDAYNVTAQVDVVYRNGGELITALPRNTAFEAEIGYRFAPIQLAPIFRFERRWQKGGGANDETDTGGGLAWFPFGHTANLKAFYTRLIPGGSAKGYDQINVQAQFFVF